MVDSLKADIELRTSRSANHNGPILCYEIIGTQERNYIQDKPFMASVNNKAHTTKVKKTKQFLKPKI